MTSIEHLPMSPAEKNALVVGAPVWVNDRTGFIARGDVADAVFLDSGELREFTVAGRTFSGREPEVQVFADSPGSVAYLAPSFRLTREAALLVAARLAGSAPVGPQGKATVFNMADIVKEVLGWDPAFGKVPRFSTAHARDTLLAEQSWADHINLGTVYSTLASLVSDGTLRPVKTSDYEFADFDTPEKRATRKGTPGWVLTTHYAQAVQLRKISAKQEARMRKAAKKVILNRYASEVEAEFDRMRRVSWG